MAVQRLLNIPSKRNVWMLERVVAVLPSLLMLGAILSATSCVMLEPRDAMDAMQLLHCSIKMGPAAAHSCILLPPLLECKGVRADSVSWLQHPQALNCAACNATVQMCSLNHTITFASCLICKGHERISLQGYWTRTAQQVSSCYAATCGHACQGTEGRSAGR